VHGSHLRLGQAHARTTGLFVVTFPDLHLSV
jgi:hypothetical protein